MLCVLKRAVLPHDVTVLSSFSPNFQDNVKRLAVGIWKCGSCGKVDSPPSPPPCLSFCSAAICIFVHSLCMMQTVAGGAWQTTTTAAATVRSAIRRLKEQGVVA
jgi:large subunit ribosomal protein L37Ae